MIYLDGSSFFFDIESCFSNLIEKARSGNPDIPDNFIDNLIGSFSEFYSIGKNSVSVLKTMEDAAKVIVDRYDTFLLTDHDCFSDMIYLYAGGKRCSWYNKSDDMKIRISNLISHAERTGCSAIILSNPCFPTSLFIDKEELINLADSVKAEVIVDESHLVNEDDSQIKYTMDKSNLTVLKKIQFGGNPVFIIGSCIAESSIDRTDAVAAEIIYRHNSAIKTAVRKKTDSINSLYIRIKKLAVKYDQIKRLYRSRSDNVYMECDNSPDIANKLLKRGIKVGYDDNYIWFTSGSAADNDSLIEKFEEIFTSLN